MNKKFNGLKFRVGLIFIIISCFVIVVVGRSLYLQVFNKKFLSQKFHNQTVKFIKIKGQRGSIYDKNGEELAVSIKSYSVAVNTIQIDNNQKKQVIKALSNILDINSKILKKKLSKERYFIWVKRKISYPEYLKLKKLNLKGVHFVEEFKRVYPNKRLASHILGFCNIDGVGIEGVEYKFNQFLTGKDKKIKILKDAKNNIISVFDPSEYSKYNGKNVYLTIDKKIQSVVEDNLREWVKEFEADKGVIIIMNPNNGEIYAMASYPDFDPNRPWEFPKSYLKNLAINFNYEPGSTFKPLIVADALDKRLIDLDLTFFLGNYGYYRLKRLDLHDHGIYKWLNIEGILVHSSNIGMARLANHLGPHTIYNIVKDYNFGEKTGIDLPGEGKGIVKNIKRFSSVSHLTMSFGQGISVTPIQLIRAYAAIVNNGELLKPLIVKKIEDSDGTIIKEFKKTVIKKVLSKNSCDKIKNVLVKVVKKGTGKPAYDSKLLIGGKTGTAQIASTTYKGYLKGQYISSFIGFFPAQKPEYLMLMLISKPKEKYYATDVVCPIFKIVAQEVIGFKSNKRIQLVKRDKNIKKSDKYKLDGLSKKEILEILNKKKVKNFEFLGTGFLKENAIKKRKNVTVLEFN